MLSCGVTGLAVWHPARTRRMAAVAPIREEPVFIIFAYLIWCAVHPSSRSSTPRWMFTAKLAVMKERVVVLPFLKSWATSTEWSQFRRSRWCSIKKFAYNKMHLLCGSAREHEAETESALTMRIAQSLVAVPHLKTAYVVVRKCPGFYAYTYI